jgi:hypothetical protein
MTFLKVAMALALLSDWASAQTPQWVGLPNLPNSQQEFCNPPNKLPPTTADAEILVELVGIPNASRLNSLRLTIRRVLGLGTACAFPEADGDTTINYDPNWAAGDTAGFYLALGHEAGHHFCGHFLSDSRVPWPQKELEADQFGGASIKRFEVYHSQQFLEQVLAAAADKYPEQGSFLYPSRAMRLEAIRRGYDEGSPCGGLAPVERPGYSPTARPSGPPTPCRPVRTGPTSYTCAH